jgi:catechol 2,3-dioxygenase-like lactoylglutathione lyase family enzyme
MLTSATVTTMLPVVDLQRARDFYENILGLRLLGTRPDGKVVYACGGGALVALFPRAAATKAEHTAISFQVEDIAGEIAELAARGVVFEDYDMPNFKTVNHVCVLGAEKAAWFKDPEGNVLCLHEDVDG